MKHLITYLFVLFFLILPISCNVSRTQEVLLTLEDRVPISTIEYDTVFSYPKKNKENFGSAIMLSSSEFVIVGHNSRNFWLEYKNLHSGESRHLIPYGRFEGQLLSANLTQYSNELILYDFITKNLVRINKDSISYNNYAPSIEDLSWSGITPVSRVMPYKDRYIGVNPFCFESEDGKIKNVNQNRFIVSDSTNTFENIENRKFQTSTQGIIIENYNDNKIVYLDSADDIIEIFDSNLNMTHRISGPVDIVNDYIVMSVGDAETVVFKDVFRQAYTAALSFSQSFLTTIKSNDVTYLLHLSYDGELISVYNLGNVFVSSLSTIDEKYVYLWMSDLKEDLRHLIKIELF